jgi:hypothetical protein
VLRDHIEPYARREPAGGIDVPLRDDADEVLVALLRRREQHQVVDGRLVHARARHLPRGRAPAARDVHLAADDRADALILAGLVVLDRPEHVPVVRQGDGPHPQRLGAGREVLDAQRAVEERVLRVHVEVDELSGHSSFPGGVSWVG